MEDPACLVACCHGKGCSLYLNLLTARAILLFNAFLLDLFFNWLLMLDFDNVSVYVYKLNSFCFEIC